MNIQDSPPAKTDTKFIDALEEFRKILFSINENLTKVADLSGKLVVLTEKNVAVTEKLGSSVRRLRDSVD